MLYLYINITHTWTSVFPCVMENKLLTCSDPVNKCITLSHSPNLHLFVSGLLSHSNRNPAFSCRHSVCLSSRSLKAFLKQASDHPMWVFVTQYFIALYCYVLDFRVRTPFTVEEAPRTQDVPAVERCGGYELHRLLFFSSIVISSAAGTSERGE